jgi:hypothetical protein
VHVFLKVAQIGHKLVRIFVGGRCRVEEMRFILSHLFSLGMQVQRILDDSTCHVVVNLFFRVMSSFPVMLAIVINLGHDYLSCLDTVTKRQTGGS